MRPERCSKCGTPDPQLKLGTYRCTSCGAELGRGSGPPTSSPVGRLALLGLAGAVVAGAVAIVGTVQRRMSDDHETQGAQPTAPATKIPKIVAVEEQGSVMVSLGLFRVNLKDRSGDAVLSCKIALEVEGGEAAKRLTESLSPKVRYEFTVMLSALSSADFQGAAPIDTIRQVLLTRAKTVLAGTVKVINAPVSG